MATLRLNQYVEALKSKFTVRGVEPKLELELIEVQDHGRASGYESFVLQFRGPREPFIPQQLLPLEHGLLGLCDIFVVPVGQHANGYIYEAVFNQLVSED